jgi:peptidoglycan/xylan/chitin deacetylase (PgdA/CDA1 family)
MMSIGMHCRLLGKPGRIGALQRFLDHIQRHDKVWITRRIDIARHWHQHFPFADATASPLPHPGA